MNRTDAIRLLRENKNERGIEHWKRRPRTLRSFGIGLTQLRKLAKKIGRDHALALKLWKTDIYDAKILGLLIDDPKLITRNQVEEQVEELHEGHLAHVFSSCDSTLTRTSFVFDLCRDWMEHSCESRRRCAYGLLYELSRMKKNIEGMDEDFFMERILFIQDNIRSEEMWVREAMNTALMGIGKRTRKLNTAAIKAAKKIGPVEIDYGDDNSCQPLDVLKHLTSDSVKKKFA